jgi:RNA polymerase sigma-70 factor, ECF subfamily
VRVLSDGGGEFTAARVPVVGRDRAARFLVGVARRGGHEARFAFRRTNGLPAVILEVVPSAPGKYAPRFVLQCDLAADGLIAAVHIVLATPKLTAVRPV